MHVSFDTRVTAKFSIIMETMGYLLLDFNKKPKQLDRLVGYIAMVHKDMRLDEQDMRVTIFHYFTDANDIEKNSLGNFNGGINRSSIDHLVEFFRLELRDVLISILVANISRANDRAMSGSDVQIHG